MKELKYKIIKWFKENKENDEIIQANLIDICLELIPEFQRIYDNFMVAFYELVQEDLIEMVKNKDINESGFLFDKYRLKKG